MLILINFAFKNIIIPLRGGGMWKCVSHLICLFLQRKQSLVMYDKQLLICMAGLVWFKLHNCRNEALQLPFYFWLQLKSNSTFLILFESIVPSGQRYKMGLFVSIWICKGRFNYQPGLIPVLETAPKVDGAGQAELICILAPSCNLMASTSGSRRDCQEKKEKKRKEGRRKKKPWNLIFVRKKSSSCCKSPF